MNSSQSCSSSAEAADRGIIRNGSPVDVLVAGLNVVDVLARLPEEIRRGEKYEIHDLVIQGGAPAGNAACVISSLGWRTGFVGYLGDNTLSAVSRAEFVRHGVVEDFFLYDPSACPAVAIVEVDPKNGERTVFYSVANYHHLTAADIPSNAIREARLMLVDGYETEAALNMLKVASEAGCRSVVDVEAGEPAVLRHIVSLATDAILPLATGRQLTRRAHPSDVLNELRQWTRGQVIVTDGERGSWATTGDEIVHQPAFCVHSVDTTGCGDAYHGGYASALLDGFPLHLRMEFAAWVASRVALHLGGRSGLPTQESICAKDWTSLSKELRGCLEATSRWKFQQGAVR
jgi:sulfofructose kinase